MTAISSGIVLYVADLPRMRAFYESVTTLTYAHEDHQYVALEGHGLQLVLLAMSCGKPGGIREHAAVKPAFVVGDMEEARRQVAELGGRLDDPEEEFAFREFTICDGVDPEGNVIQLRTVTCTQGTQPL